MEQKVEFPLIKIKVDGLNTKFDLTDPESRKEYFEAKAGEEIKKLKDYLENNTFIAYLLGKKNSGKGTYTKLMAEIFGKEKIGHISVGDIVRSVHIDMEDESKKTELLEYLKQHYRGYISVDQAIDALLGRDTKTLLPTEFIMALVKREIDKMPKKALFIDGFPREMDQISYAMYFRNLIDYRQDPDLFVAISIPTDVIDQRIKTRVICPKCKTPRSLKLFATKEVGYDENQKAFYLKCDNPECGGERMVGKEGDELGIENIRERLELDDKLIAKILTLHGIPKVLLRNAVPVDKADDLIDDYEKTPEYYYELDENGQAQVKEKPLVVKDDDGNDSYSLLAPPVAVSMIKQLVQSLGL
ncbi:MAG: nucleoside monophosphate kinase [Candidatus Buchananbacteria bacterium]